jgi:hypothetical protein
MRPQGVHFGEPPVGGYLRDTDDSRAAIGRLAELVKG